jgi:hypothetical protein
LDFGGGTDKPYRLRTNRDRPAPGRHDNKRNIRMRGMNKSIILAAAARRCLCRDVQPDMTMQEAGLVIDERLSRPPAAAASRTRGGGTVYVPAGMSTQLHMPHQGKREMAPRPADGGVMTQSASGLFQPQELPNRRRCGCLMAAMRKLAQFGPRMISRQPPEPTLSLMHYEREACPATR